MSRSITKFLLFLYISCFSSVFSQSQKDTQKYVDWAWGGKFDPMIDVNYGISSLDFNGFTSKFSNIGAANVMLGYSEIVPYRKYVVSLDERFAFFGYHSPEIAIEEASENEIQTELQRFGIGTRSGYGYKLGPIELLLYSQGTFLWSKLNTLNAGIATEEEYNKLKYIEGGFRFGHSFELGAKLKLLKFLSVNIGGEASFVYTRHIFWPWLGSYFVMGGSFSILGTFGDDIVRASPLLGPVIYFALKTGLAVVFYNQIQEKMYWPFEGEPPLTYETIKIGATITF